MKAGDPLIEIDLDAVARGALSLVTPIVVANAGFALELERPSRSVARGERIATVRGAAAASGEAEGAAYERTVRIDAAHGLHARPAARIAALLRPFAAEVSLAVADRSANARSTVAMLGLGVRHGDELRIVGRGADRAAAVDAVAELIAGGVGEAPATEAAVPALRAGGGPVTASPGLAVGTVVQLRLADLPVARDGAGVAEERRRLAQALEAVAGSLIETDLVAAELAAAHRELLGDPDLIARANSEIDEGRSAAFAWRSACAAAREAIRATGDPLLIERAADLMDLERRVIAALAGEAPVAAPDLPPETILVAPDLLPSQLLAIDKSRLAGICTADGGPTSHVAILAASAGIPMLVAAGADVLQIPDGTTAILDADQRRIDGAPSPERLDEVRGLVADRRKRRAAEARDARELCFTADGERIEVFANLGSVEDAHAAVAAGAEGCGLLRTEFLFLDRATPPDKEEQQRIYREIAMVLGERPLILRTLDLGADKSVPYVAIASEDNPALGLRGIRLSFARPDLLATQLAAIVAAVPPAQCRIMLPMITEVDELQAGPAAARRRGPGRRAEGARRARRDDRNAGGRGPRRFDRRRGRLPVGRDQRPHPICPRRRPWQRRRLGQGRCAPSGGAAADPPRGRRRAQARQMDRGVRRARVGSDRRADPDRPRRHRAVGRDRGGRDDQGRGSPPQAGRLPGTGRARVRGSLGA